MFFAHSLDDREKICWQPLRAHLRAVGELAGAKGHKFGASNAASLAGLLHDLGKYSVAFQRRLEGADKVDATAGAQEILKLVQTNQDRVAAQIIAHAIAGHHAGLPDSIGELDQRLKKNIEALDPVWCDEINPDTKGLTPSGFDWGNKDTCAFRLAFLGRMLFSCLVDADFRDTEQFYCKAEGCVADRDWPELPRVVDDLIERFDCYMQAKKAVQLGIDDTPVNRLRGEILAHVRDRAASDCGLFTLTVPTGGGKTLSSLAFALEHAKRYNLDRIVYAIPFTSIIDQTASIFRDALGDDVVLEHHSSIDEEKLGKREARDKLRLAMEDWAAPIVVTTNVQLFESLQSNRPSRCRRLHNLARAVIVLDEAQTIPLPLLRPCLATLDELARNYNTSIVLCTATQPAVAAPDFEGGLTLGKGREVAPDPARLHNELRRVRLAHLGDRTDEELLSELAKSAQGLIIVNSRAHALALFKAATAAGLEGVVHLTTRQHAAHRRAILARVRTRLKDNAPWRVIATSHVEAGVDLDFPRVWRAEAGLDQFAQAAGRCNREGTRPIEDIIDGAGYRLVRFDQPERCWKLTRAETRLVKALAPARAAIERVEMLTLIVLGSGLGGVVEMRFNHIFDVNEHGGGALLPILVDNDRQIADVAGIHRLFDRCDRRLVADLVAPDRLTADWLQHMDRVDDPADRWLAVNRLQNSPRGRRRHQIIRDAFDLHFRPCEAREITRDQ
jgi:CRISPR-associated endonuclease/helicase Cas3